MPVEVRPLGVSCNLRCGYCYQQPQRDARNIRKRYDLQQIKQAVLAEEGPFTLFGGEPLLLPKRDLHDLWAWGLERFGRNAVQTNATLIDPDHIEMFRRYRVRVGVSIDGPGQLNDTRWHGTLERTRSATADSERAIERLLEARIPTRLIVTLHRQNAAAARLPALLHWLAGFDGGELQGVRLHLLETENDAVRLRYALDEQGNTAAMLALLDLARQHPGLRIEPFAEMRRLLLGDSSATSCVWHGCDPYNTAAVQGVEGHGERSNCGRTNKDGVDFEKAADHGPERSLALYRTSQDAGGCAGCRFFLMCKGHCPGSAIDRDWRNRSEHCATLKAIYGELEAELALEKHVPVSLSQQRERLEQEMVTSWALGSTGSTWPAMGTRGHLPQQTGGAKRMHTSAKPRAARSMRLQQPLPAFTRISWTGASARSVWEPRLRRVAAVCRAMEVQSVIAGVRPSAVFVGHEARDLDRAVLLRSGLVVHRLWAETAGASRPSGVSRRGFALVLGRPRDVRQFTDAWETGDGDALGALLGYPRCCQRAFSERGGADPAVDPIWSAAAASVAEATDHDRVCELDAGPWANLTWTYLHISGIPHQPCASNCSQSETLAENMRDAALVGGIDAQALRWLDQMLAWPAEWSALHGIAEVKQPILKLATASPPTDRRRVVRYTGRLYPDDGARGLRFPFLAGPQRPGPRTTEFSLNPNS